MRRREFLAAAALGPSSPRITRLRLAPIQGRFHKFVAMNSYDTAPKGHTYSNTLVRVETSAGVEGVGVMGYSPAGKQFAADARALLGANPLELYEMSAGRITGRAPAQAALLAREKHLDGPLFDLIGKLAGQPAWRLLGEPVRDRIEVYDGTLYFSDVWFADRGIRAVVEEAEEAARKGYRGVKLKVGRGSKWMEREAGLRRDIEVVLAVRRALGGGVKILIDANNAYRNDFDGAWKLLAETAAAQVYWLEEVFPEDVALYTRLRERMEKAGLKTLIADGETVREPRELEPFVNPKRLVDVLQTDIRTCGFLGNLEAARMGEAAGAVTVPHNWGSRIGLLMGLQMARAVKSIPAAEDDRSTCDVVVAEGYEFRDGLYRVPDAPGLGLRVDEKVYRDKCKAVETVIGELS
jgi:D-galactarolactone cycloisomerase